MPQVIAHVCAAQDLMREQVRRAATIIRLPTPLHIIATANMTPSFRAIDGIVRPVHFYAMAMSEFAGQQTLRSRLPGRFRSILVNVQDFVVNVERWLRKRKTR
jgi:hypothetical protein